MPRKLKKPTSGTISLIDAPRFLEATRESGYRSTSSALAELVDNSLQAQARNIEILFELETKDEQPRLAVVDDGIGMSRAQLSRALQFGGSSRFNDRSGLGRFGVGLPNASLSQARRVDLFTWNPSDCLHSFLDIDLVKTRRTAVLPAPRRTSLPSWPCANVGKQGTAVIWTRWDRLAYKRGAWLQHSLREELGRIFRQVIQKGIRIRCNDELLEAIDPVLLTPAPDDARPDVLPTLRLQVQSASTASWIQVRFSCLPLEAWSDLPNEKKKAYRISNRAGISVLRAGREVAYGWHFLGTKRRENYDDWWRCEISFDPLLDEEFGVINNKQGIRPSARLSEILVPVIETQARTLNRLIRARFEAMHSPAAQAVKRADDRHTRLFVETPRNGRAASVTRRSPRFKRLGRKRYNLLFEDNPQREFLRAATRGEQVTVYINRLHPFYTQLYRPLEEGKTATSMNCFLLAFGRAILAADRKKESRSIERLLERLSDTVALFLERN